MKRTAHAVQRCDVSTRRTDCTRRRISNGRCGQVLRLRFGVRDALTAESIYNTFATHDGADMARRTLHALGCMHSL